MPLLSESGGVTRIGTFRGPHDGDFVDLSPLLEDAMQLRKEVPLELVVNMFRKLVSLSSLLLPDCIVSPTCVAFCVIESASHYVLAGRRTDGHGNKNGHRSSVNGTLRPPWRARRREGHGQQQIIYLLPPPFNVFVD